MLSCKPLGEVSANDDEDEIEMYQFRQTIGFALTGGVSLRLF
jgi:hypothetical protein